MSNDIKSEKRFKVNSQGVVESVQVNPPLREADSKPSNGENKGWYNSGGKASGIGGNSNDESNSVSSRGRGQSQENNERNNGQPSSKSRRKSSRERGDTKQRRTPRTPSVSPTNKKSNETTEGKVSGKEYGNYTSAFIVLAFVFFITILDFSGGDSNVNSTVPEPNEIVVQETKSNTLDILFSLIKGILNLILNIISFIWNILSSILGFN